MKTLLLMRHAKSSWKNAQQSDHARPLNERGERDAPRMGQLLRREGLVPDLIVCSSAERASATAQAVAEASGYEGDVQVLANLYLAGAEEYLAVFSQLPASVSSVLAIGHNPGLEELLHDLADEQHPMPTAALAHLSLPIEDWAALSDESTAKLENLWLPRALQ